MLLQDQRKTYQRMKILLKNWVLKTIKIKSYSKKLWHWLLLLNCCFFVLIVISYSSMILIVMPCSIRLLEWVDRYPIRLVSLSESEPSKSSLLRRSYRKMSGLMETECLSDMKIGTERFDPVEWKHSTIYNKINAFKMQIIRQYAKSMQSTNSNMSSLVESIMGLY